MSENIDYKNKNFDLLNDIINGFSKYKTSYGDLYFKHLDRTSNHHSISFYLNCLKEIESDGILSEKEQIENACLQGLWSKRKEDEILSVSKSINRLKETKKKLIYKSDKERIEEQIGQQNNILKKLESEKREFLTLTSEQVASKKASDFYIKNFIYKDEKLSVKLFDIKNDFEYADDGYIEDITYYYYMFLEKTNIANIKKLALSSDFQNLLFISDAPTEVFGYPMSKLTKIQIDLLIWGKYFKNIIKNSTKEIPDGLTEDPDKFLEWVDSLKDKKSQKSKKSNKANQSSSKFLFGSSDEIRSMTGSDISGNKIIKEASDKGGLSMSDLMNKEV